ncbi:MAG: hypothetical protein JSV56_01745 [Methanomassiliicoccales archaeon]|nr:MAG: hypothetical protein JSV56_01745 [Methanomassiliicoccales archaeon]
MNISSRQEWEDKGDPNPPDPIYIDVIVESSGDDSPTVGEGTKFILQLTANVRDIYDLDVEIPTLIQDVDIGESALFEFTILNEGTTVQQYKVTTISYDSTNFTAPSYNPSSSTFPSQPTADSVDLDMTVTPKDDGLHGTYKFWIKIYVSQDTKKQWHTNVTVNIEPLRGVDLRAQNDELSKETIINTHANYTLIIKNTGNDYDRFHLGATGELSNLVTFEQVYVTLGPDESAIVKCFVFADQNTVEAKSLYEIGIDNNIQVTSENETEKSDSILLNTQITENHLLTLTCPDDKQDAEPGETANFILYVENIGTIEDKYVASVRGYNTSALNNPVFNPSTSTFPASPVDAGTSTTLGIDVDVLSDVPVGDYWVLIRISIDGFPAIYEEYNFTVQVEQVYLNSVELELEDENYKDADTNEYITYTLRVKNTGNGPETFEIVATGEYNALVTLEMDEIYLNRSESRVFEVEVYTDKDIIDRDELYGFYLETPIKVTSKNDPDTFSVTENIYTDILYTYDFEMGTMAAGDTMEGKPGETIYFKLEVTNVGTATDRYTFRVTSVDETKFPGITIANINSDVKVRESRETTANIPISTENEKAVVGMYQVEVTGTSVNDATITRTIILNINITAKAGLQVGDSQTGTGEPGDVIDYKFRITNKGNAPDTFDLALSGTNKDWGQILEAVPPYAPLSEVALDVEGVSQDYYVDIYVRVTIPGTGETSAGTSYAVDLEVSSSTSEDVSLKRQATTTVEDYLDLILEYSGSGLPHKEFDPNQKAPKFSFRVTNNGNQDETGITIRVDPDDWDFLPETLADTIEPGGTSTFSLEFTIPADEKRGEYELQVYVVSSIDPATKSDPVYITINITKPDLSVSSGDISGLDDMDYLMGKVGNAVTISAAISNEGDSDAKSVQVKLYEDNNVRGTKSISSISAGASKNVDFRWTVVAEDVELKIEITPQEELEEDNNEVTIQLDLRPDLSFEGEQINFSKSNPAPGEKITLTALIRNTGGDAEDVVVKFYDGTKIIGTDTLDIDHDEVGEATYDWEVPDKEGESRSIKAEIDLSGVQGHGDDATKSVKIGGEGAGQIFSGAGLLGMIVGLIIGAIIFLFLGLAMGRRGAPKAGAGAPEGAAGPSFGAFEKEMPAGADKKAPKAAPAPFERMEEEAPSEEEEKAKPKEAVARVRCPKCGRVTEVTSTQRPLQIPCECGTTLMLKK